MHVRFAVYVLLLTVATSSVHSEELSKQERKSVAAALEEWTSAYNRHDAEAVSQLYTQNAQLTGTAGEVFQGRAEIKKSFAKTFAENPKAKTRITNVKWQKLAPGVIAETGSWKDLGLEDDSQASEGLYSAILVEQDGKWLSAHETSFVPVVSKQASVPMPETVRQQIDDYIIGRWKKEAVYGERRIEGEMASRWTNDKTAVITEGSEAWSNGNKFTFVRIMGWDGETRQLTYRGYLSDGGSFSGAWTKLGKKAWRGHGSGIEAGEPWSVNAELKFAKDGNRYSDKAKDGKAKPYISEHTRLD